jgi:hypothetical protein
VNETRYQHRIWIAGIQPLYHDTSRRQGEDRGSWKQKKARSSDSRHRRHKHDAYLPANLARPLNSCNTPHSNSILPLPLHIRQNIFRLDSLASSLPITTVLPRRDYALDNAPPPSHTHALSTPPPKRLQHRQLKQPQPEKQRRHRPRWARSQLHGRRYVW